jgi:serine/threonine-protein kinase
MTCFKCGTAVPEGQRFCGHCGALVSDPDGRTIILEAGASGLFEHVRAVLAGGFDVEEELARGGMGVVFKGREIDGGRAVAIKVLSPELGITARAAERFKREARMVAEIEHPNIVPVYRVGQIADILFIAMKYIEGRSLGRVLEVQGALPIPLVLHVLRAVTRPLAYAHDRGIVHRDVKGDNILLDKDGRVLVSDFGVALRSADVTLTMDGTVIGTPAFMSPEQCRGKRAGPQSDQYSLGILAFQMLAGRVPFDSETLAGFLQHHLFTPPPDVAGTRDDVPAGLLAVVRRALAKEPGARFVSTRDMLAAIDAIPFTETDRRHSEDLVRRIAQGGDLPRVPTRDVPAVPDARRVTRFGAWRPRRAVAAAATAVVLLGGAAAIVFGRRTGAPAAASDTTTAASPAVASDASPRPPPAVPAAGKLRLFTIPPDAEILVDGRRVGVGAVVDWSLAAGPRRIQARAADYVTYDTLVQVRPRAVVNLGRVALRARGAGP